jgi:CRISPR-associated endonuclease/helicase Cas3
MPVESRTIHVPTGAGKTAAAVLAWLWNLRERPNMTPLRLVYCLPMRALVEQTAAAAREWTRRVAPHVNVHVLMGGEVDQGWEMEPEKPAIFVGTQDMLLSRALNRGYGMSRYQWPVHFGLLNNSCLWVLDEVQLMGSGLGTTTQLDAFREIYGAFGPCATWWMSATLDKAWLETVDFRPKIADLPLITLQDEDRNESSLQKRYQASKPLERTSWLAESDLANLILERHQRGSLTIAVVNTVVRAQKTFQELDKKLGKINGSSRPEIILAHSRFRAHEREALLKNMQEPIADTNTQGKIIIATQVVEAGVDISARTLITDLAPWSSLVQRFGRCNRAGEFEENAPAQVVVLDVPENKCAPYELEEMESGRKGLDQIASASIPELQRVHTPRQRKPSHVIRRKDLIELFDTTPDLGGADLDVSRYIREGEVLDVEVYWRRVEEDSPGVKEPRSFRKELCPVPVSSFRDFLEGRKVFRWNPLEERWQKVRRETIAPGQLFLIPASEGGYSPIGWDPKSKKEVSPVTPEAEPAVPESFASDLLSQCDWGTIADHTENVFLEIDKIVKAVPGLDEQLRDILRIAARWHDRGKAHEVFQTAVPLDDAHPHGAWAKAPGNFKKYGRKHFRHELASALAVLMAEAESIPAEHKDLVAYLAASHHGRVRLSVRSMPNERVPDKAGTRFARGVWDGDILPIVDLGGGITAPEVCLSLECMQMGLGVSGEPSWVERMLAVRDRADLGVFRLAYLESLLRAADRRASAAEGRRNA